MIHITSTHYSHNSALPTTRSDGFLWTTTSCCRKARSSSSSNSSSACCCNTRCYCNTCSCNTLYRAKINVSANSDILAAASHAKAAAVFIPGSTSTHMKRRCNFRSEDVPRLGLLHEVAPAVPSAGRTRVRTSCCLRRRDGKESSAHPQRWQGVDPTCAQHIIYYTPEAICQKCILRT